MTSGTHGSSRACHRRTSIAVAGSLLATQTAVLLLAVVGPGSSAQAAVPATPVNASEPADCGLQLLARTATGGRSDLRVGLPERLAGGEVPPRAFSLRQADRAVPVTVRREPPAEQVVAVVLASSSGTSPARFEAAKSAARGLLGDLPPGTTTAVGSTAAASPVAPLSVDPVAAARSVDRVRAGGGSTAVATVDRLARDLPAGAHVVLFTDGLEEGPNRLVRDAVSRLQERGTVLTRIGYAGPSSPAAAGAWSTSPSQRACTTRAAAAPLAAQVQRVQTLLRSGYRLSGSLDASAPATLSVAAAGAVSTVQVPAVRASAALRDPYGSTGPSRDTTLLLLAGAVEIAVLGLLLLLPPRARRPAAGPQRGAQSSTTRPERSSWVLRRVGPGARPSG